MYEALRMKKVLTFILLLAFICISTSACSKNKSPKPNMIQAKRRFANYLEPQEQKDPTHVDLSEGPKLKYDANFGPKKLNFDIKVVDPY